MEENSGEAITTNRSDTDKENWRMWGEREGKTDHIEETQVGTTTSCGKEDDKKRLIVVKGVTVFKYENSTRFSDPQ